MSNAEIKEEIQKKVDKLPADALSEILEFIDKVQSRQYIDDKALDEHMDAIISENRELLQRLAQ